MEHISSRVPSITFVEEQPPLLSGSGYLGFCASDKMSTSDIGMDLVVDLEVDTLTASPMGIAHEILHALGMEHEMKRPGEQFPAPGAKIKINWNNINGSDHDQFTEEAWADVDMLSPYDHHSLMHYPASVPQFATGFPMMEVPFGVDTCPDNPNGPCTDFGNQLGMSKHDINALLLMYPPNLLTDEIELGIGATVVATDFDRDGQVDVLGGAPGIFGGSGGALAFKGTHFQPVPWMMLSSGPKGRAPLPAGGTSMVIADFNDDGFPDVAIGCPSCTSWPDTPQGGKVTIHFGGQHDFANFQQDHPVGVGVDCAPIVSPTCLEDPPLDPFDALAVQALTVETLQIANHVNVDGDQFGASLAVGDLNDDGIEELLVGAPGKFSGKGRVYVFDGSTSFATGSVLNPYPREADTAGTGFGSAVAAADLDGDQHVDVAVGAPAVRAVFLYQGEGDLSPAHKQTITQPSSYAHFGKVLATGPINLALGSELVVGVPGKTTHTGSTGAAMIYSAGGVWLEFDEVVTGSDAGHQGFGSSILVAPIDGDLNADIIVGAPNGLGGGRVSLFDGATGNLRGIVVSPANGGLFGSSLAMASVTTSGLGSLEQKLLVGAPTSEAGEFLIVESGAIFAYALDDTSFGILSTLEQEIFAHMTTAYD